MDTQNYDADSNLNDEAASEPKGEYKVYYNPKDKIIAAAISVLIGILGIIAESVGLFIAAPMSIWFSPYRITVQAFILGIIVIICSFAAAWAINRLVYRFFHGKKGGLPREWRRLSGRIIMAVMAIYLLYAVFIGTGISAWTEAEWSF